MKETFKVFSKNADLIGEILDLERDEDGHIRRTQTVCWHGQLTSSEVDIDDIEFVEEEEKLEPKISTPCVNSSIGLLSACERYGINNGCDEFCPVLIAGKCEIQDSDNDELYKKAKALFQIK